MIKSNCKVGTPYMVSASYMVSAETGE